MTDKNENIYFDFSKNFWCALWCPNATNLMNKGIQRFKEVFNSCRPHHKKGNLIRGFLFCCLTNIRQKLRVGAVLREQNALPCESCATNYWLAKDAIDNGGAGRAAKGAIPGRSLARYSVATLLTPTTKIG